jgi:hypothetical protein
MQTSTWREVTALYHHDYHRNQRITIHHHHVETEEEEEIAMIMGYP